jgi:uncharacterized protein YndB with AHSA1/START domain
VNGTLLKIDGRHALRFERRLAHPVEKVWRALTEPGEMSRWFPATPEWDLVPGAKIVFRFREEAPVDDMTQADFEGEVVAVEPPRLLEFTWADELLRWELAPDGDGTLLTFTTAFDDLGKASRDAAGWDVCLEVLEAALDGREVAWDDQMKRWNELFPGYVESLGPEASVEGKPEGM